MVSSHSTELRRCPQFIDIVVEMLIRPKEHLQKDMDMIGHHLKLKYLDDRELVWKVHDSFCDALSELCLIDISATRIAGSYSGIACNCPENCTTHGLFKDNMIDGNYSANGMGVAKWHDRLAEGKYCVEWGLPVFPGGIGDGM